MAKLPTLALIIIYGNLRIGKSALSIKALEQALIYLKGIKQLEPKHVNEFMGFDPNEVVDRWLNLKERKPCFIWDDAGFWLHSMNWSDPVMVSIQQYFNVIATDYNTVILTTPDPTWILSKISNMIGVIRIKVIKRDGGIQDNPSTLYRRLGIGYKPWRSPDLKRGGVNKVLLDEFNCMIRQDLYDWYKPIRERYAYEAKQMIKKRLKNRSRKDELDELKTLRSLKNLEKELFKGAKLKPIVSNQ
jgi:hypothetical protein